MLIKIIEKEHKNTLTGVYFTGIEMSIYNVIQYMYDNNIRFHNMSSFIYDFIQHYHHDITMHIFTENKTNIINQDILIIDFHNNRIDIYDSDYYPHCITIPMGQQEDIMIQLHNVYKEIHDERQ